MTSKSNDHKQPERLQRVAVVAFPSRCESDPGTAEVLKGTVEEVREGYNLRVSSYVQGKHGR
jgi:hypothetical protein